MTLSQRIGVVEINTLAFQIPSASKEAYKSSFFPQTIRDWNDLPDSLISSAEMSDDCVSKFAKGLISPPSEPPGEIMSFGVSPVNYSDSETTRAKRQWIEDFKCVNFLSSDTDYRVNLFQIITSG